LKPLIYLLQSDETPLLRDWRESTVPVFFDFGDNTEQDETPRFAVPVLWRLDPLKSRRGAYVTPVRKDSFAASHKDGSPLKGFDLTATFARRARAHFRQHAPEVPGRRGIRRILG
jgi:hypothetical protein